ncbi:hypothetical protein SLE2022_031990 [Rubroshorea leprosula]
MLGFRGSAGILSDVSRRLHQTVSLYGIQVRGIRVGGTDIPDSKRLAVSLTSIYGVGPARARQILSELNITNKHTYELTGRELNSLREYVSSAYVLGEDLKRCVKGDLDRLINIQCYRGFRHQDGLPCRGQRTKTNARTIKDRPPAFPGVRRTHRK